MKKGGRSCDKYLQTFWACWGSFWGMDGIYSVVPEFLLKTPLIDSSVFVAKSADVIGDVTIGKNSSVWYQAVIRGDIQKVVIGEETNIQDGVIIHLADEFPTIIGSKVTVGHRAILHACHIEDEVLVGMGATILDGARIGRRSIIGAGAVVTPGMQIPPGSLVLGVPATIKKALSEGDQLRIKHWAEKYVAMSRHYLKHRIT